MMEGGPAFGPRPEKVVPEETAESLVEGLSKLNSDLRKLRAWERFLIYTEAYEPLIARAIWGTHNDQDTRAEISRFIDLSINIALDITNEVAVVWKHPAIRRATDNDEANDAFLELVDECRFDAVAKSWNRQAWYLGPIIAVPVMRGGRITHDTLLPHFYDVIQDPEDPWGNPLAAAWDVYRPNARVFAPQGEQPEAVAIVLDGDSFRYYGKDRKEPVHQERHSLGRFPGATLRFDQTHATDWWGCDRHQRLTDATVSVGVIQSALGFVRKSQNKKLLTILGDLTGFPKKQKLDPELPVKGHTDSPEQISVEALDFDTDPKNFIAHAVWIMNTVARSYGADLSFGGEATGANSMGADVRFSFEAQTELRNEQIPFARDFERDLWVKTIAVAKANNWRLADKLPDPEEVQEKFQVSYPQLSRTFASPADEIAYRQYELQHGKITYGDLLITDMPGATADERHDKIMDNIKKQGEVIEELTKRDQSRAGMPGDPTLKTPAQQFGAKGPMVRDGEMPPPEEDKDEEKDDDE